jgi:hypothetical protein
MDAFDKFRVRCLIERLRTYYHQTHISDMNIQMCARDCVTRIKDEVDGRKAWVHLFEDENDVTEEMIQAVRNYFLEND